jgi:hypothetical protein
VGRVQHDPAAALGLPTSPSAPKAPVDSLDRGFLTLSTPSSATPDARVRGAALTRAMTLPGKRSNGGRGALQLNLRQARSARADFPRDSIIAGWSDCCLDRVASVPEVSPRAVVKDDERSYPGLRSSSLLPAKASVSDTRDMRKAASCRSSRGQAHAENNRHRRLVSSRPTAATPTLTLNRR